VATFSELVERNANLTDRDREWLHTLVADWQVIADLAFADLVLWLPRSDGEFVALAQCRSSSGPTVHYDDIVGRLLPGSSQTLLATALETGEIQRAQEPRWFGANAIRDEAVPVVNDGRVIAVIARQTNLGAVRTPSRLELNYVEAADELCRMVARGEFPSSSNITGNRRGAPRVADGFMRLDADGVVTYSSPNALSCAHRVGVTGSLVGRNLLDTLRGPGMADQISEDITPLVLAGRTPARTEIQMRGVCISLRAIQVLTEGKHAGAILLCRDVTELRRRERELITKDATIREINHRVKNNLQTVSALLRMQARRMTSADAKSALEEAMRRVTTIAMVHEALSTTLDETVVFDDLIDRILRMTAEVASADAQVTTVRHGSFGLIPAEDATPLALVLTELVSNAVQHGIGAGNCGTVEVRAKRNDRRIRVEVLDDGAGIDEETPQASGLGTQIVSTLVENELNGTITWKKRDGNGTRVVIKLRVHG
jgi:two-component sensor histidine kinase